MAPSAIGAPLCGRSTPAMAQRMCMVIFFPGVVVILVSLRPVFPAPRHRLGTTRNQTTAQSISAA